MAAPLLQELQALLLARELIGRRARVSIVHRETGISRVRLRALYRAINGRSAPCGQLPAIGGATIQTRKAQLHASLFARIYERLGGAGVYQTLDVRSAMHAHDLYRLLVPEGTAEIDFTLAWVIARDLRVGASVLQRCERCELRYLVCENSRTPPSCPICALSAGAVHRRSETPSSGRAVPRSR